MCLRALCIKGAGFSPGGKPGDHTLILANQIAELNLAEVETTIRKILQAGYGHGTIPLWDLYFQTIKVNLQRRETSDCLEAVLKMYCLVEPAQVPRTALYDQISTLYVILSLMNVPRRGSTNLEEFPVEVQAITPHAILHLRAKLVADTTKCFGVGSAVAKFEKKYFRNMLETLEKVTQKQGYTFKDQPLKKSFEETSIFVKKMNELLEWAAIPAQTEAQLLAE